MKEAAAATLEETVRRLEREHRDLKGPPKAEGGCLD
jgi:hypothetical protein